MGLASALTTALTGLQAAETTIDVAGNNLANSQTVGFKASDAVFVTQFLQTQSLGSAPSSGNGGTNPRQTGLGVRVGEITPDFSQGTIEVSSSPSDLAIQGDGFFMVQGAQDQTLYTRNGIFKTNSDNQLVTTTGQLVLGFGVDEDYAIEEVLAPIEIPLGNDEVAKATSIVTMQGTLTPTGDLADAGEVIESVVLGNGLIPRADADGNPGPPTTATAVPGGPLTGNYSYVITYFNSGGSGSNAESRPSVAIGPTTAVNSTINLADIPPPPAGYDQVRVYRNTAADSSTYYLAGTVLGGASTFSDTAADATIAANPELDMDGPRIIGSTKLVDVIRRDGLNYENMFEPGTLTFQPRKGGRLLAAREFVITDDTDVQQLLNFMEEAMGIQKALADPTNPIPGSVNNIPGDATTLQVGGSVTTDGQIRIVGNNGVDNAIEIGLAAMQFTAADNTGSTVNLSFSSLQDAVGQSAVSDFIAYDSLGTPINVRVTAVLESVSDTETVYRWFADSPDNEGTGEPDVAIAVGTGLIRFDGEGNMIGTTNDVVNIERRDDASTDPLAFRLDFGSVSGLAATTASLSASRQDGSAPGSLSSYVVGEDGLIRGVYTNGVTRDLGQIRMARFQNPAGLIQVGETMFAQGINSGLPLEGNPNENGIGKILAGARELSNTDIGKSMIDLVLATTQYRGNSRVISTAQQLLDELFSLRR